MTVDTETKSSADNHTITASHGGNGWVDIIEMVSVGDRIHVELPSTRGELQWHSGWVTDTGDEYAEIDRFRLEVTSDDEHVRFTIGDGGVKLLEDVGGEWVDEDWTASLNSLEVVPREAFEDQQWYEWEVGVSEVRGGGVSTDQTVFPEAPTREAAEEKGKRWAEMETGYTRVVYQDREITVPAEFDRDGSVVES